MSSLPSIGSKWPVIRSSGSSARTLSLLVREPNAHRVRRLTAGNRKQLKPPPAQLESVRVVEKDRRHRLRLDERFGVAAHGSHGRSNHVREEHEAAPAPEGFDALVIALAGTIGSVRNHLRALLLETVDASDVIDVPLGKNDVAQRASINGIEQPLVMRRLESHAGVDDDVPLRRDNQVRVRRPRGHENEVVDADRFRQRRRSDRRGPGTRMNQRRFHRSTPGTGINLRRRNGPHSPVAATRVTSGRPA
jgi:hypothetical protein